MWSKTLAGVLLALPVTVLLIGWFALLWPGKNDELVLVWLLWSFPLWVAVLATLPLHRRHRESWFWLGGLALLGSAVLLLIKTFYGAGL
jgi:hypothetical protein